MAKPSKQVGDFKPKSSRDPLLLHATLTPGGVYDGEVVARAEDGTYTLQVATPHTEVHGARIAAPVIGGLMGFQVRTKLLPGTTVKFVYGKPSVIFAVIPKGSTDSLNAGNRSMLWGDKAHEGDELFSEAPEDLHEGEFDLSNLFGISLQMLTTIARMTAGGRAAVEVHLINGMLRMISDQYRHISGMGDELIFDHGRPTLERGWSSYRHEIMNKLKELEPVLPMNGDGVDREAVSAERTTAIGRYRFLEFMGFAGDFIHSFVTDPTETIAKIASDAQNGAGKSWIHRNSDGSLIVQSVADIRFERVCRIPVPVRVSVHEDQEITQNRRYDQLNKELLKLVDFGAIEKQSAFKAAYNLRMYSRWLSRYHAFARMLQLSAEYKVPTESDSAAPTWTNKELDVEQANPTTEYFDAYACISILRDGSIVTHDGYGSSVVMSNGNVQVSAARHLDLEASGDIRIKAGGSLYVRARRNIELSAQTGGMIMHAYAFIRGLAEKGSLWLRSDANTDPEAAAPEAIDGGLVPEVAAVNGRKHAILLETPAGALGIRTQRQVCVAIEGKPEDVDDRGSSTHDFIVETEGHVRLNAIGSVVVASAKDLVLRAAKGVAMSCKTFYGLFNEMTAAGFTARNGRISANAVSSGSVKSNAIYGRKIGPTRDPGHVSAGVVPHHLNHILALPDNETVTLTPLVNVDSDLLDFVPVSGQKVSPWLSQSDGARWGFFPQTEYKWDAREQEKGALVETITQQYIRNDVEDGTDMWDGDGYESWTWDREIEGVRLQNKKSWGVNTTIFQSDEGENLHAPSDTNPSAMAGWTLGWQASNSVTFKALKR